MPDGRQTLLGNANFGYHLMMAPELLAGRYELRGTLGRGGMAEVHDGWDTRLNRAVAIKLLHPALSTLPESRQRFDAEARSAAALSHPNIVAVHDSGEHGATPYIVMERLPGHSLADVIARGPLPQPVVRTVLDQVVAALAAAHEAGILHRDIKPGNILFAKSGDAKVTDFGIAKTAEVSHTMTGQIVGTVAYLSPERLAGRPASTDDDLYALGVVGYEALTGRRPFIRDNLAALARAICDHRPLPIAQLRPDVDPHLAAVVERAMARDPGQRFRSAWEMRAALAGDRTALLRPPTMVMASPVPPMPTFAVRRRRPVSRNKKVFAAMGALLAIALIAVAFALDTASQRTVPASPAVTSNTLPPPPPPVSIGPVTTPLPPGPPWSDHPKHPGPGGKGHHGED
jgi:serine/threonine protein kinase